MGSPYDFDDLPDEDAPLEEEPDLEDLEDYGFDVSLLDDYGEFGDDVLGEGLPTISELLGEGDDDEGEDRFEELDDGLAPDEDSGIQDLDPNELAALTRGVQPAPQDDFEDFEDFGEYEGELPSRGVSVPRPAGAAPDLATSPDAWVDPRFVDRLVGKWDHDTLPPLELRIEGLGDWFYQAALHMKPFVIKLFSFDPPLKEPPEQITDCLYSARKQFLLWNVQRMELDPTEDLELERQGNHRPRVHRLEFPRSRIEWQTLERSSTTLLEHGVSWIHSLLPEFSFQPVSRWPMIPAELGRPDPPPDEPDAEESAPGPEPEESAS